MSVLVSTSSAELKTPAPSRARLLQMDELKASRTGEALPGVLAMRTPPPRRATLE